MTTGAPAPAAHDSGSYAGARSPRGFRAAAPLLQTFDRRRLRMLRAAGVGPPARLLDAGAGRGRFVAAARATGYEATAIEAEPARARAAASLYGVDVAAARIEQADVRPGSLDAISVWHVLEHLEEPGAALERAASWLRPGGVILVGVPNLASWQARLGGRRWFHLDLPRHRTHFTPAGLHTALRRAGLEPVATHHLLAEHNPFGMWQSLVNHATRTPSYAFNAVKRNAPLRSPDLAITLVALPLLPFAALLELAAGACRRGGTIAVAARRPG